MAKEEGSVEKTTLVLPLVRLSRQALLACGVSAFSGLLAFNNEAFAQTDACAEGYVWRQAFAGDHVCVARETRDSVADQNRNAEETRKKDGGGECEPGYVWRMAGPQEFSAPRAGIQH